MSILSLGLVAAILKTVITVLEHSEEVSDQ